MTHILRRVNGNLRINAEIGDDSPQMLANELLHYCGSSLAGSKALGENVARRCDPDIEVALNCCECNNLRVFTLCTTRMSDITAIQFTQDQTRTLTGVSAETVRHWRKTIPYLSSRTGKAARFSFTDLVGLAVTNELVTSFGVHIAAVSAGVDSLFALLASSGSSSMASMVAFITPTEATLRQAGHDGIGPILNKSAITIPLAPYIEKIQQLVLPVAPVSWQTVLPFSLEAVRSKA